MLLMVDVRHSSSWPGERDPSHQDVAAANERPDPVLLSNFTRSLIHSDEANETAQLLHMGLRVRVRTYLSISFILMSICLDRNIGH